MVGFTSSTLNSLCLQILNLAVDPKAMLTSCSGVASEVGSDWSGFGKIYPVDSPYP